MKFSFRSFLIGILSMLLLVCVILSIYERFKPIFAPDADSGFRTYTATLIVDGETVELTDSNGKTLPFAIRNGQIYVPAQIFATKLGFSPKFNAPDRVLSVTSKIDWSTNTDNSVPVENPESGEDYVDSPVEYFDLGAGLYVVGDDIPPGKYFCEAIIGTGNFQGDVAALGMMGLNELMGIGDSRYISTYSNLRLAVGDTIKIRGELVVRFSEAK